MSTTYNGVELESTMLTISGNVELDDDQAEIVGLGGTVQITLRGRVKGHRAEVGGQNTRARLVAVVALDALDTISETDALPGQLKLGEEPETPSDDA